MEKTILIDGQKVRFKTNGATPLRYKAQFGKDYFKEIFKMLPLAKMNKKDEQTNLETLDFDVFYNVAWIMAKTADPTIPAPMEWLEQFDEFPIAEIFPELQDLMLSSMQSSKKNFQETVKAAKAKK